MSPSQALSTPDQEKKVKADLRAPEIQDDINLRCMNNCEDNTFDMEASLDNQPAPSTVEDPKVDVLEWLSNSNFRLGEDDDPDANEYSSSFGDTDSEKDDGSRLSDAEVNSQYDGDYGSCPTPYDLLHGLFPRKKKPTDHWRRYIRPLMWRCKWVELRIKEFQSQASKYERELEAYDQRKQSEMGKYVTEDCMRSLAFSKQNCRKEVKKRRKRKRIEDSVDVPSYMSLHNLISYYETKKSNAGWASVDEDCRNPVIAADFSSDDDFDANPEWTSVARRNNHNSLEQILWKIEIAQAKAQQLNKHIDYLLATKAENFSSMENRSQLVPSDLQNSSVRSCTSSPGNADTTTVRLYNLRYGDAGIPDSAGSSHGEVTPLPDITESTTALYTVEDQPRIRDSGLDLAKVHNHTGAKESIEEQQDQANSDPTSSCIPAPKSEPVEETTVSQEHSVLKPSLPIDIHVPKNKRKRGQWKASSSAWNAEKIPIQRSSDEPDKKRSCRRKVK